MCIVMVMSVRVCTVQQPLPLLFTRSLIVPIMFQVLHVLLSQVSQLDIAAI